ncbi:MAG TPA: thiolase family protein [Acidimicrobiales bacterium]
MSDVAEKGAIVSGLGISRIGRKTGIPGLELTTEAATAAIADAGLTAADIDGISTMGETPLEEVIRQFGLDPRFTGGGVTTGGLLSPVMSAFLAVAEGRARHVLVYRTVQMMGGSVLPAAGPSESAGASPLAAMPPGAEMPPGMAEMLSLLTYHAYAATNWLAMHCRRHMHLYGTTKEQLGWLAVQSRLNAARNPLAAYRDPISLDDYLNARPISEPFGLLDCDVPIDGSVAMVISAADHAADCPSPVVRVEAMGGSPGLGGWDQRPDYPKMASADAAVELWSRTDLRPSDVDVAELYDGFTFLTFAWLEALGFCGEGEAGPFVEGGTRIGPGGQLPLNTYGGQLSAGRMHGYWVLHEACLQLRGQAGERQVPGAQVAVAAAGGGPIAGCILLTS